MINNDADSVFEGRCAERGCQPPPQAPNSKMQRRKTSGGCPHQCTRNHRALHLPTQNLFRSHDDLRRQVFHFPRHDVPAMFSGHCPACVGKTSAFILTDEVNRTFVGQNSRRYKNIRESHPPRRRRFGSAFCCASRFDVWPEREGAASFSTLFVNKIDQRTLFPCRTRPPLRMLRGSPPHRTG
jgi:hypothetical protein